MFHRFFMLYLDRERLVARLKRYFNQNVSHEEMRREYPEVMNIARRIAAILLLGDRLNENYRQAATR